MTAAAVLEDNVLLGVPPGKASALCVFLHGRGQSPELMVDQVISRLSLQETALVLPRAPSGAWYDARAIDPITDETEGQLDRALDIVAAAVARAIGAGAPADRLVLAGFSQGACLALEYALRRTRPAALVCLTGCRVGYPTLPFPGRLDGLPVYAACGDADPWIPLDPFMASARLLADAGARLTLDVLPGRPHEISDHEVRALEGMLRRIEGRGTQDHSTRLP